MNITGRVQKLGNNINTDIISPGQYMSKSIEIQAQHSMEAIDPDFAKRVVNGDVIVAGDNFGSGSSRETAQLVLKHLGVSAIIAKSFARIFFRNCINLGIPVITLQQVDEINQGDQLEINLEKGVVINHTTGLDYEFPKIPSHLLKMVTMGGLEKYLKNKRKEDLN